MSDLTLTALWRVSSSLQVFSMVLVCTLAALLGGTLLLSIAGLIPAFQATLSFSDGSAFSAGLLLHGIAFLVSLLLVSYMPANWRMRRLEAGHRSFRIGMEDVTRAYEVAHAADRSDQFTMHSEYDAVRERLSYLASHPDLGHLEPEILEVAAQMGRVSEDLAETYSDAAVARARGFLAARQHEIDKMEDRIERAFECTREIRRLHERISLDEDVTLSRLERLKAELDEVLPDIGLAPENPSPQSGIVRLRPVKRSGDAATN